MKMDIENQDHLEEIKSKPHWRIVIRPNIFEKEKVPQLNDCKTAIIKSRVLLRGWDYPHIDENEIVLGNDWIEGHVNFQYFIEFWRLYQSGQFIHLFRFREDGYIDECADTAQFQGVIQKEGFQPSGYLGMISALYSITEIFEFATRLASNLKFDKEVVVRIDMKRILNRVIYRGGKKDCTFYKFLSATQDDYTYEKIYNYLIDDYKNIAIEATMHFLARYGWLDVENSKRFFIEEQNKYYSKKHE